MFWGTDNLNRKWLFLRILWILQNLADITWYHKETTRKPQGIWRCCMKSPKFFVKLSWASYQYFLHDMCSFLYFGVDFWVTNKEYPMKPTIPNYKLSALGDKTPITPIPEVSLAGNNHGCFEDPGDALAGLDWHQLMLACGAVWSWWIQESYKRAICSSHEVCMFENMVSLNMYVYSPLFSLNSHVVCHETPFSDVVYIICYPPIAPITSQYHCWGGDSDTDPEMILGCMPFRSI